MNGMSEIPQFMWGLATRLRTVVPETKMKKPFYRKFYLVTPPWQKVEDKLAAEATHFGVGLMVIIHRHVLYKKLEVIVDGRKDRVNALCRMNGK